MHWIDYAIIIGYTAVLLGIGVHFLRRQERVEEYFVGDRKMGWGHIGFSVVATDVGGGFSIGLGGLGFAHGLSGSWLLFTGLVGAWAAAVLLLARVKRAGERFRLLSFPDFLEKRYGDRTRLVAAVVSAVGYAAFVGAQILAGAVLCAAAFGIDQTTATLIMAAVVVLYTSFGGIQAVIYTDTIQWIVLLVGLIGVALPIAWYQIGDLATLRDKLPPGHFDLTNIDAVTVVTWMFTIVPIWFVGMTLYQRIYATRDERTARRAWYMAGLLEWPLMAFLGVLLGMYARAEFPGVEPERGLPMLIGHVLPTGIGGLVMAAYFSAIMSTADSCLLASTGNFVNDLYQRFRPRASERQVLRVSRWTSATVGVLSVGLALVVPTVLESIMLAYTFLVSGLFVPTLGGLLWRRVSARAALWSMLLGGGASLVLEVAPALNPLPASILLAMPISLVALVLGAWAWPNRREVVV